MLMCLCDLVSFPFGPHRFFLTASVEKLIGADISRQIVDTAHLVLTRDFGHMICAVHKKKRWKKKHIEGNR